MKNKIIKIIKKSKIIYLGYYYLFSFVLKVVSLFIKIDKKTILFESFAGKNFDDSPLSIFNSIKDDPYFREYKLIWILNEPDKFSIPGAIKVKNDSLRFFYYAMKSGIWIVNTSIERRLSFKRKGNFCINTWHGTPLKRVGIDIDSKQNLFRSKTQLPADLFLVQGDYEKKIFGRDYRIPEHVFRSTGLPRNDILVSKKNTGIRRSVRNTLGIENRFAILYAPTFREYSNKAGAIKSDQYIKIKGLLKLLPDDFVVLFRAHSEVEEVINGNALISKLINVSKYPVLNDLIIGSDLLVSDYSSILFDYAITDKPMIAYTDDFDEYQNSRGMYFDVRNELLATDNLKDLATLIKQQSKNSFSQETHNFKNKFIDFYGHGTDLTKKIIIDELTNR